MVSLTETAMKKVVELMNEGGVNPDTHHLRVGVGWWL